MLVLLNVQKTIVSGDLYRSKLFQVTRKMPSMQYNVDQFEWIGAKQRRNGYEGFYCVKKAAQIKDKCYNNASVRLCDIIQIIGYLCDTKWFLSSASLIFRPSGILKNVHEIATGSWHHYSWI